MKNIKNILNGIGIHDVFDLVFYFPRYYKDYTNTKKIIDINIDDEITLQGEILLSRPPGIAAPECIWNGFTVAELPLRPSPSKISSGS
ncbi:MAG: hypothetical protein COA80_18415 [Leeuwenhoekiella sp.]|nr:MAG: hypothetical protein COA80_18415 [Leeuwenhoekiella sp.]